jgi:hypothetical protein
MLAALHSAGLRPDLIFIDADKQAAEIQLCDELFPEAIVCGDDWLWLLGLKMAWGLRKTAWKRARQGLDSAGNPTRT